MVGLTSAGAGMWEAIGYYGRRVERIGLYTSREAAVAALQRYVTVHAGKPGYGRPI